MLKPTVGFLNNVFLLKLKGLTGIIRSLPLTLRHVHVQLGYFGAALFSVHDSMPPVLLSY